MASRTPVTIGSSPSDEIYRVPSITPDAIRHTSSNTSAIPSSPQLLSPSTFTRPRAPLLKSGSKAQQVPAGANAGFASAANLWRAQEKNNNTLPEDLDGTLDKHAQDGKGKRQHRTAHAQSTGKLSRPRKTIKVSTELGTATEESTTALPADLINPLPGPGLRRQPSDNATPHEDMPLPRRPSINLSEFSFDADRTSEQPVSPKKKAPAVTKPGRKRKINGTEARDTSTGKKPRKAKAKSEAIILDSDEPEEAILEARPKNAKETAPRKPLATAAESFNDGKDESHVPKEPTTTGSSGPPKPGVKETSEQSAYFAQVQSAEEQRRLLVPPPSPPADASVVPVYPNASKVHCIDILPGVAANEHITPPPGDLAPRRRRSWTPPKNQSVDNTMPVVNYALNENMDQIPFSEMLGNFSYLQAETPPAQRITSGGGGTKRRRMELSNVHTLPQPKEPSPVLPKVAPRTTKKTKAPKKAQTITALATAAFQPAMPPGSLQSTVSAFFTPRKETMVPSVSEQDAETQAPVKSKKPRKPRAKAKAPDDAATVPSKHTKPRSKPKAKVKFNPADHQPPLYSPSQARKEMKSQEFLFGTSSQLAADESPEFIQEIQSAMRQSEMISAMPSGSQTCTQMSNASLCNERSYAKVPTAPHGTCLSIEQAHRELWCVSARDVGGAKYAQETQEMPRDDTFVNGEHDVIQANMVAETNLGHETPTGVPNVSLPVESDPKTGSLNHELATTTAIENADGTRHRSFEPKKSDLEDDWMLLRSEDSEIIPQPAGWKSPERAAASASMPVRRTALRALDANVSIAIHYPVNKLSPYGHYRPFSTTTTDCGNRSPPRQSPGANNDVLLAVQPPSRGRGRPRKDSSPLNISAAPSPARSRGRPRNSTSPMISPVASPVRGRGRPRKSTSPTIAPVAPSARSRKITSPIVSPAASPARGRGRPRKDVMVGAQVLTSPARGRSRKHPLIDNSAKTSPVRGPGRPRKTVSTDVVPVASPKRPVGRPRKDKPEPAVSQKVPNEERNLPQARSASQPEQQKNWTNIDEISDSDSPATPSPRRRRASSSPAFVQPLDFTFPNSPSPKAQAAAPSTSSLKATDPIWPAVQASIYPQISQTIKSAPSSQDMDAPSWHDKILLYDPIVLEDLTAWLNKQGLRTEVKRLKPKTKARGRKKKDAPPEVDEWEVVRDELKAWMVQKWCEDQSICCLWKEGLRGGVKARY